NKQGVPLSDLRELGRWMRGTFDGRWASLNFYVCGKRVFVKDPQTGQLLAIQRGSVGTLAHPKLLIDMTKMASGVTRAVNQMRRRSAAEVGRIERNRYIASNAWVVAGTRIPTETIFRFHQAGYGIDAIIAEYPSLKPKDVQKAIEHEQKQQRLAS